MRTLFANIWFVIWLKYFNPPLESTDSWVVIFSGLIQQSVSAGIIFVDGLKENFHPILNRMQKVS